MGPMFDTRTRTGLIVHHPEFPSQASPEGLGGRTPADYLASYHAADLGIK